MTTPNDSKPVKSTHYLMPVADAATVAGLSTKRFLVAAAAGQLGDTEILQIGTSQYVRGSSLFDFLEGKRTTPREVTGPDASADLFR